MGRCAVCRARYLAGGEEPPRRTVWDLRLGAHSRQPVPRLDGCRGLASVAPAAAEMTAMNHIDHITLDTGHVRRSPRAEAGDDAVDAMRESLEDALTHPRERTPLPAIAGYSYNATAQDGTLMVTIWGTVRSMPAPVVTFGVARAGGDARGLWHTLHDPRGGLEALPYATDIDQVPSAPWLAARRGARRHADATGRPAVDGRLRARRGLGVAGDE